MSGSVELLKLLGSGVRPAGADQAHGGPPAPSLERADFAALLKQARSGGMPSHLPVTVESGANVQLSADELEGLSAIADRAEAAGVRSALVMFPDKTVVLDVHTRSVKAAPDMTSGGHHRRGRRDQGSRAGRAWRPGDPANVARGYRRKRVGREVTRIPGADAIAALRAAATPAA
jgi:hypothetical protein